MRIQRAMILGVLLLSACGGDVVSPSASTDPQTPSPAPASEVATPSAEPTTGEPAPRNVNLVTGASGTTDIEGVLVRGAHGPRSLHVVVADRAG